MSENQTISKERVTEYGEVFTSDREVKAMLDLVREEGERIESRHLEPACGTGNFLIEILRRKLETVEKRYNDKNDCERYAILAVSSVYGVDILYDNVEESRKRLLGIFTEFYRKTFQKDILQDLEKVVKFILSKNIIWGDTIEFTQKENNRPIIFSEWSILDDNMTLRREFLFESLKDHPIPKGRALLECEYAPKFLKEYPAVHYLRIADNER